MATATKKKPKHKQKAARRTGSSAARKEPAGPARERGGEPERSAPQLAEVDAAVLEFIEAIDRFKKQNGRPFPSWSEVLLVLRQLGYSRP